MKKDIHPKYYPNATITCVCGATYTVGSTMENIKTEICSKCHPFYTGTQKLVDTAKRVDKFQKQLERKDELAKNHKGKKAKSEKRAAKKRTPKKIDIKELENLTKEKENNKQ